MNFNKMAEGGLSKGTLKLRHEGERGYVNVVMGKKGASIWKESEA